MSFANQTVIVTGAGQGIRRGVAEAYAQEGASVVLAELNEETGKTAAEAIRQAGGRALFVPCDVRKEADIVRLMETAEHELGRIDILINNAGVSRFKPTYELTVEEWDDVLNTNVRSTFLASREMAKRVKGSGRGGAIVNISSTRSIMSEPGSEAYAASKGAIVSITHALAVSLGRPGLPVFDSPGQYVRDRRTFGGGRRDDAEDDLRALTQRGYPIRSNRAVPRLPLRQQPQPTAAASRTSAWRITAGQR